MHDLLKTQSDSNADAGPPVAAFKEAHNAVENKVLPRMRSAKKKAAAEGSSSDEGEDDEADVYGDAQAWCRTAQWGVGVINNNSKLLTV